MASAGVRVTTTGLAGNVRELERFLYRAQARHQGGLGNEPQMDELGQALHPVIGASSLPELPQNLRQHPDLQGREILLQALKETRFNHTAAAARPGLSLRPIRYRIDRLKTDVPLQESPRLADH